MSFTYMTLAHINVPKARTAEKTPKATAGNRRQWSEVRLHSQPESSHVTLMPESLFKIPAKTDKTISKIARVRTKAGNVQLQYELRPPQR